MLWYRAVVTGCDLHVGCGCLVSVLGMGGVGMEGCGVGVFPFTPPPLPPPPGHLATVYRGGGGGGFREFQECQLHQPLEMPYPSNCWCQSLTRSPVLPPFLQHRSCQFFGNILAAADPRDDPSMYHCYHVLCF